jgi:hypothetical protein
VTSPLYSYPFECLADHRHSRTGPKRSRVADVDVLENISVDRDGVHLANDGVVPHVDVTDTSTADHNSGRAGRPFL